MPLLRNPLCLQRQHSRRSTLKRTLIIGAAWVGDAVLSQPLFSLLLTREPDQQIHVLAPSWTHGVLGRMKEVHQVLDNPFRHGELSLGQRRRLGLTLNRESYDQAIVLPNSFKSALVPWFAGIPRRTGYRGEWRQWLLNDVRQLDKSLLPLMVQRFSALALPPGTAPPSPPDTPRLTPHPEAQARTLTRLGLSTARPVGVLCPGAEFGPAKRWPERHYRTVAQQWMREGFQIWVLGSGKDHPVAEHILQGLAGPAYNLCGQTALDEAVDLMALADRVVSNDSGLMHVAAALDRPMVALFGSSSPEFTPPLSAQAHVETLHLSCSPCFKRECPLGHLNCLEQLLPERVLSRFSA